MSFGVLNELRQTSAELSSEKISTRNKAIDNFYNTLSNSKNDIIKLYRESTEKVDPSWGQLFNNSVDAAISHSVKVHEAKDSKGIQTLRNRNHLYSTIINKLIDYSLEDNNNFLMKSTVLSAFFNGFDNRIVVKNFCRLFLQILERGVYESEENSKDLKFNEYSKILSVLFEVNIPDEPSLKTSVLRCINKTLELCQKNVQLSSDYKDYFDDVKAFALDARDESEQANVIKMFHLFISELSIDYHVSVCGHIQEILPILCGFYNYRMRTESKTLLFRGIYCSLNTLYPNLSKGDYNPIGITFGEDWLRTLRKLMAIVDLEAKERTIQLQRPTNVKNPPETDVFIKISAMIVYLMKWSNTQSSQADAAETSRAKISRNSDQLESVLTSTTKDNTQVIQVWLEIFTELIETQSHLINPSNYMTILDSFQRSLLTFNSWQHLRCLRLGFTTLLKLEDTLFQAIKTDAEKWAKIVEFLIADTSSSVEILREKQLLLQELIRAKKLCLDDCTTLLSFFLSNNAMRRNDCIATIREIMRCSEYCGFDKTSDLTGKLLTWLNQLNNKMDGKSLLLHIEPLNEELIADTNAVMVINFLDSICPRSDTTASQVDVENGMELLNYKYCRKYICIEQHGRELRNVNVMNENKKHSRCLIQSNYELLMRLLNFETSSETKMSNINVDLSRLLKMVLLLRKFFDYDIFNESTYLTCPLIKRIGFFLDNIDFQLKSIVVNQVPKLELLEATKLLLKTFTNICSCEIFLNFLTKQNIDGIIAFAGSAFKFSESNSMQESKEISQISLQLLSTMCASPEHSSKAFVHIKQQRLSTKTKTSGILTITKIFCQQQQNHEIAVWFVDKLKTICQLYYTNVEVSEQLVDLIPDLVRYVEPFFDELHSTFVIISSFLKIASKKFYSSNFAVKLIKSIRQIVKFCPKLIASEDFTSICVSLTKFLLSQSLAISLSVVNTVTALMDSKWVLLQSSDMDKYFRFCCTLYSQLDWNKLSMETDDVKTNSLSVTLQLLTSLFAFSSFHREVAFQELGNYYAAQGLSESNFSQFSQIAAYYGCSLFEFTKPYADSLLYAWLVKKNPMTRFPYFLCLESRTDFFSTYLPHICYYQLRFSPTEGLEELIRLKYGRNKQIVWKALPLCYAYLLNDLSGNTQLPSITYATDAKNLLRTLKTHNHDLVANGGKIYWTTISSATKQLWDESHFASIFGFNCYTTPPVMSLNFVSLKHNLQHYLETCYKCSSNLPSGIDMLIKSDPMALLKVLTAFKLGTSDFIFLGDKLKSFYWFCAIAEIVIESVSKQINTSAELSSAQSFFLRDILFFILNIIDDSKTEADILKAGLHFLNLLIDRNISTFSAIISKYLNEIACVVVSIVQKYDQSNVQEMAISFLELIVCQHKTEFFDAIKLLDKFPDSDVYQNLRDVQRCINTSKESDLCWVAQDFLNAHTKGTVGIRSMKQCIAERKGDIKDLSKNFGSSKNLLYDLLKRLVDIVRSDDLDLAIESAKCLGEIGSVKISETSFYFEGESTFYDMEFAYQDEMEYFVESSYRLLEKLLLRFDSASSLEMHAVCKDLAKSKIGSKALGTFPMFGIFAEQYNSSVLDFYTSIAAVSFVDILKKYENLPYNEWIKSFSSAIFRHCEWESFAELCQLSFCFSEFSIVPIFKVLIKTNQTHFDNIVAMLDFFFARTFEAISNEEWKTIRNIYSDKRVIKTFLNICECIRICNNWKVPLNILNVAKACIYCQAYFMGILYLEMWALEEKETQNNKPEEIIKNPIFQEIATQAYTSIDCVEAISGFLDPLNSRLEYLSLKGDWSQVLMEIDATNESNKDLYAQNLKSNGLLLLSSSDKLTNKRDYECCWRLGQWDTTVESNANVASLNDLEYEFEKNHFNALKSIYNKEEVNCLAAVDKARQAIVSILKEISTECLQSIYKYLTWLHLLQQAEDFCKIQFSSGSLVEEILQKWKLEQDLEYGNFNCTELVLSHQMALYKTAGIRAGRKIKEFFKDKSAVGECILKCIGICKNTGNINLAIRNVALLKNIETSETTQAQALLEDADICRKTGKNRMAKEILYNVMLNKNFIYCLERVQAHRMYGELLLETNSETFDVVHEEIFVRSVKLLDKYPEHKEKVLKTSSFDISEFEAFDKESRKLAFATIAKYADKEYMQLNTYLNSVTFRTKVEIMEKNKQEASTLSKQTKDRDKSIGINVLKLNCGIDSKEMKMQETKRSDNLCIAMDNYIQFCKLDEALTSPAVYRIIALWFANKHDPKLHAQIESNILEIPSYKFLCVLNQMSARLGSKNPTFQSLLAEILVKCIEDHPHHTLYKILALVFAHADDSRNASSSDRETIAKNIINKARNKSNTTCIKQMESMFSALIDFANKDAGKNTSIALSSKLKSLKNLDHVQCPTIDLPIALNKDYNPTYIRKWEENVGLVGGINAPKKLMCICSDGVARPQLLKGKDDLRQDAVMQQVLAMVNELLWSDPETNEQKLLLRTYKVVPLSMRSGILEWCNNTVPLGIYLCGDKENIGAHTKYRPNDYSVGKCRKLAMEVHKTNFGKQLEIYQHICKHIQPVFHYFFFEKFLIPGIWFERRLAYVKSVATTSIVGFILGLGDRHTQNILIDKLTAEVIHIDFGIAFEQGKIMPTPETVPFRLTRDIVAPMGVCKTDGVFSKICEKTMKILRKNDVFLTTILEVLLYDPLYVWKWSSQKLLEGDSDENSEEKNLTAQRALLRVQDKLEGKQEGQIGAPSVEVQVERLINEAMNPHNLCRLYPGWDPYL